MEGEEDKPVAGQLCFLCGVESAIHTVAMAFYRGGLFCRAGIVYPGE